MRNRSFLPLMEILCMVGVFAIASAICLQSFAMANDISKKRSELDAAVLLAQDTCEILKYTHGDMDYAAELTAGEITADGIKIYCTGDKRIPNTEIGNFEISVTDKTSYGGIGQAKVSVCTSERTVYEVTVAWQEYEQK